jgi:hypothetical protein
MAPPDRLEEDELAAVMNGMLGDVEDVTAVDVVVE